MPNDNIKRTIEKALGAGNADNYEHILYEGYGPSGVAVIVDTMTDNRNRTASEVRHGFDKYNGNMGAAGCVSWSFDKKGVIVIDNEDGDFEEDKVLEDVMDAGGDDLETDDAIYNVYTKPDDVSAVADALTAKGYPLLSAQVEMIPQNGYIKLSSESDIKNMAHINSLSSEILDKVVGTTESGALTVKIPLGNLTGVNMLMGRGPDVPVKIIYLTSSKVDFKNELVTAGINQTKHQLSLEVTVDVDILVPWRTVSSQVVTDVLIADTVIVGQVPDTYVNME